jgi:hypothetical protein
MPEEARPEAPFGLRGEHEHIWHIAAAERWSDGVLVGHQTFCGRNYPATEEWADLAGLAEICSDCTAQIAKRH